MAITVTAHSVWAQLPHARLDWVFPNGAQPGATLDVTVGGGDLDFATAVEFSHPGLRATLKYPEATEFNPQPEPIANTFQLSVAADVPPGVYDMYVVGRFGVSTPRRFVVEPFQQLTEQTGNETQAGATPLSVNATIAGRASGSARDYFRLPLKQGQRVFIDVLAQRIDSQMDATLSVLDAQGTLLKRARDNRRRDPFVDFTAPADGDYWLELYDFTYRGGDTHFYRLNVTDQPRIDYAFPASILAGTTARVALFGRNLPGGSATEYTADDGTPLQRLDVTISAPTLGERSSAPREVGFREPNAIDVERFLYQLPPQSGSSNLIAVALAAEQVVEETEPNRSDQPQVVTVPCEYVGRFYPKRDEDWVQFTAAKGDAYWIEVVSERMGLSTDPYLLVQRVMTAEDGSKQYQDLADADDGPAIPGGGGFNRRSQDPIYRFEAPEAGTYRILVRDVNGVSQADSRNLYRLIIRRPWPTFELFAATSSPFNPDPAQPQRWSPIVRRGGAAAIAVSVVRKDGFAGPIAVQVENLPPGVTCEPAQIGAGKSEGVLIIRAAADAPVWHGPLRITGTAIVAGREVVKVAQGATLAWDAPRRNDLVVTRLTSQIFLAVVPETAPALVQLVDANQQPATKLETARGGKLSVPFKVARQVELKDKLGLGPVDLPGGVKAEVKLAESGEEGTVELVVEPGAAAVEHTIAFGGKSKIGYVRNPEAQQQAESRKQQLTTTIEELTKVHQDRVAAVTQAASETEETKAKLQAEAAEAEQKLNAAKAALAQLEERLKQFAEINKPQDVAVYVVSTPVTLKITDTPLNLQLPEEPVGVASGASSNLDVAVVRHYEFADVVNLEVTVPESAKGLTVGASAIPADQSATPLKLNAAADAVAGTHTLLVRAKFKYNGHDMTVEKMLRVNIP
jgi:hypothetical protein